MKVCSIFSQVLKLFSRGEFEKAVKERLGQAETEALTFALSFAAVLGHVGLSLSDVGHP